MGFRPFTLVIEEPRSKWFEEAYFKYYIAPSAVLHVNGQMVNIKGFVGKSTIVSFETRQRVSLEDTIKCRRTALEIRGTLCNHINMDKKYVYNIQDYDCNYCFNSWTCSKHNDNPSNSNKVALIVEDLYKVSTFGTNGGDDG